VPILGYACAGEKKRTGPLFMFSLEVIEHGGW
jgi:hypothetical protein